MRLRVYLALICSSFAGLFLFVCGLLIVMVVREHLVQNQIAHSLHVARMVSHYQPLQSFMLDDPDPRETEQIQQYVNELLNGDPFIQEISFLDPFGKLRLRVEQDSAEAGEADPVSRSSPSLQTLLQTGEPELAEESREFFIPLAKEGEVSWGVMRVRWNDSFATQLIEPLRNILFYGSLGMFAGLFLLLVFLLRQTYAKQHRSIATHLRSLSGKDFSQRIETHSLTPEIAHIGVYINRILREVEEEKKKALILDDTLRQVERGYNQSRKSLEERNAEMTALRSELRDGLRVLFDSIWCGIVVLDDHYRIHSMNEPAERLLRYAKLDHQTIVDERLRDCLAPMIRDEEVERIDDLCVWPLPNTGRSLTCRMRSAKIPTMDGASLYFLVLREESGFPSLTGSAYFSERIVMDFLAQPSSQEAMGDEEPIMPVQRELQERFRICLNRILFFQAIEKGELGQVTSIRLAHWLRDHFITSELFAETLRIDTRMGNEEASLQAPERALREYIECILYLVHYTIENQQGGQEIVNLCTSCDPKGKPMMIFSIPGVSRHTSPVLQSLLDGRMEDSEAGANSLFGSLTLLERDICFSVYKHLKSVMKTRFEYYYSTEKSHATIRLIFENQTIQPPRQQPVAAPDRLDPVQDLMQSYLSQT